MKRVRNGIRVGAVLAGLLTAAQSSSAGQFNLIPVLQISGQHTDNVLFATAAKQSDTVYVINPGIGIDFSSDRFVGSLSYQLGMQRFVDFKTRDNDVHRFDGSLGINLTSGLSLSVSDNMYITTDPLAFDASGDRLQRDSFNYNRITPALSYTFGANGLRLGVLYDRNDVDYKTLVDSHQDGYGGNVAAKLGSRSTVRVDYFEFKRRFDRQIPSLNVVDYDGKRYGARLDRRFSSRLSGNVYVGFEERKFAHPANEDYDSALYEVGLTGEFPDVVSWSLTGSQRLNDLAIKGVYKVRHLSLDLRKSIAERLRLEFNGFVQESVNRQIPEAADFSGYRIEGQYLVTNFLNIWLGYEYLDRSSKSLVPFTENRVNFGLTFSYGL